MTTTLTPTNPLLPSLPDALDRLRGDRLPAIVERALAVVLSHLVGEHGANHASNLSRLLLGYAHAAVVLDDGSAWPAPWPEIDRTAPVRDPAAALRRHGETRQSVRISWRRRSLAGETLPVELLRELVAPELWPVLGTLIVEGPRVAAARVNMALLTMATQPLRRRDRRHDATSVASDAHLALLSAAASALMRSLVALQISSPLLGAALDAWQAVPEIHTPVNGTPATLTTAPTRAEVRALWRRLDRDIARRLPAAQQVGELEAVRRLTRAQADHAGLFTPLRLRVVLILLAVVGSRVGALPRLRRCDFVRDHVFPDGQHGPALALRPGKRTGPLTAAWKGLPDGAAAAIEVYLAFMELHLGPFTDRDRGPLVHASTRKDTPWGDNAICRYFGGCSGARRQVRAVLPRGADPTVGYTPHTFRSWCAQTIRSLDAHELLIAWRVDHPQHWITEALLDHRLDGMPELYGGASKAPDREHLSRIGIRVAWELLAGDAGARRVPDAEGYRQALQSQLALSAEVDQLGRDVDRAFQAPAAAGGDRVEQLLARVEQLMHAHAEVRRERQAYEQLVVVERELEAIRHNPERLVLLPDDADGLLDVDLAAVEAEVRRGAGRPVDERRPLAVRDWISVGELRELVIVGAATVPRWLGQGGRPPQLPFPDGDPRNPWPADRVPVDASLGQRRRRIIVAGISETFLLAAPGRMERLEAILATPGPAGWPREHCDAPLVKPAWMG